VHNLTHLEALWNKWCTIIFSVEIVDVHVFTNLINRVYRNCEVCTVGSKSEYFVHSKTQLNHVILRNILWPLCRKGL